MDNKITEIIDEINRVHEEDDADPEALTELLDKLHQAELEKNKESRKHWSPKIQELLKDYEQYTRQDSLKRQVEANKDQIKKDIEAASQVQQEYVADDDPLHSELKRVLGQPRASANTTAAVKRAIDDESNSLDNYKLRQQAFDMKMKAKGRRYTGIQASACEKVFGASWEDLQEEADRVHECLYGTRQQQSSTIGRGGLLVLYLDVGQLSPDGANDFVKRFEDRYKHIWEALPKGMLYMIIPVRPPNNTHFEVVKF